MIRVRVIGGRKALGRPKPPPTGNALNRSFYLIQLVIGVVLLVLGVLEADPV